MEEGRSLFLNSLHYIIACQIIYMYFLDFNLITLFLHLIQLLVIYHGSRHNSSRRGVSNFQKSIFICIVIFSNLPVIILHIFSETTSPIVLTFVSSSRELTRAALYTLLYNDALIIMLESFMVLHRRLLECG